MRLTFSGIVVIGMALVATACARTVAPLPAAPTLEPTSVPSVSFPRDAQPHDVLTEWWYVTGHLRSDSDGHEYGFEFTVFQARRQDAPTGYLAHFAVSDVTGQRFSHQSRVAQGAPFTTFPLDVGGWTLASDNGADAISAAMDAGPGAEPPFAVHLELSDQKPPALHHGGFIGMGPAGGSYYYSRTRLQVRGSVSVADGPQQAVSGIAWLDHQWGNFLVTSGLVWDWFSLQLDDRTELMLYVLRGAVAASDAVYGSQILSDGTVVDLPPGAVRISAVGSWTSPHTGGVYPSGWRLTLPDGETLQLTPSLADQELYFPGVSGFGVMPYWEGAVSVTGDRTGVGYVELTGYAKP